MSLFLDKFGSVFDKYDDLLLGEIDCEALHKLYRELRPPGIRLLQVKEGIESIYSEGIDTLDKPDFEEGLAELDRRYFLLQDLVWEFKVLARDDLITTDDALLLIKATHEQNFSLLKYEKWLKSRVKKRGSGVAFNEIDLLLCSRPTPDELIAELPSIPREHTQLALTRSATTVITDKARLHDKKKKLEKLGYLKKLQDLKAKRSENLNRRKDLRDEFEVNKQDAEEKRKVKEARQLAEAARKQEEEEEERRRNEEEAERARQAEEQRQEEEEKRRAAEEKTRTEEQERAVVDEAERRRKQEEEEKRRAAEARIEEERVRAKEEEERKRAEEESKQKQKEEAEAAAAEADRRALEELEKESDKATHDLLTHQREEDIANKDKQAAEELLNQAKTADNKELLEEAQRKKHEADTRVKRSKINKKLAKAIQSRELRELEPALADAKKKKIEGTEEKMGEAEELIKLLYAALNLENATRDRQIEDIESALRKIHDGNYETVLAKEVNDAEFLLKKLKRLEFLKRQVMELKQQTIAELKSYSSPPAVVKHVMTATFLILGHDGRELHRWPQLVVLMGKTGKESLKRRIQQYEPDNMEWEVAEACRDILAGMDTGSVADVSAGAAAFFIWCEGMVEERLTLPQHIPKELKDKRRASLNRAESNKNLMKGRTVEVVSRRSRSKEKIEPPRNKPRSKSGGGGGTSKSPAAARSRRK